MNHSDSDKLVESVVAEVLITGYFGDGYACRVLAISH